MIIQLKKDKLVFVLRLALSKADAFNVLPKTREVKKFSFKKMKFETTVEPIYYDWYIWQVSLPKFIKYTLDKLQELDLEFVSIDFHAYCELVKLSNGEDFDPFIIGKL